MPARLTRALVNLHGGGRADVYGPALLDVAQDHLLASLVDEGLFEGGSLIFKGGTSLRKCRLGSAGRFSTDLDFCAPDEDVVLDTCSAIDGLVVGGFTFTLHPTRGDGRHWSLRIRHDELGSPDVDAAVEFARRPLLLPAEHLDFVAAPVHRAYDITLPTIPVIAEAEACAEKLARYRRTPLARDVYDLAQFATRHIDESLVRRLWAIKVWADVVDDGRGTKPLSPSDVLTERHERDFQAQSIGALTQPIDVASWERRTRNRFRFLADLDEVEQRLALCDPRDRALHESASVALRSTPE